MGSSPISSGDRVAHLLSFLCCALFGHCLHPMCPMLLVSLVCPFMSVPSVFSNVYSTIVNGVAEERCFRVSTLSVPGEGYSRNA
jgi:hypothetical protein